MQSVMTAVREEEDHYKHGEERPLRSYTAVMSAYGTAVVTLAAAARLTGKQPDRPGVSDTVLMAGGTYKLARLIARIRSPARCARRSPGTRARPGPRSSPKRSASTGSGMPSASW